ncbi:dynamin family protein, partial [Paenibacillus turpanensis]|uniref:dynamin family protein n=1 Tax=Paenibacillus turpanensis TaxID=2689078 RepID=UPI001A9EB943
MARQAHDTSKLEELTENRAEASGTMGQQVTSDPKIGNQDRKGSAAEEMERLERAAEEMENKGNGEAADKIRELADKRKGNQLYIALCGHFSAGKSSLVNRLCEAELLPSSPVPTSANIISIQYGDSRALVFHHGRSEPVEVPVSELGAYARNGAEIERVKLYHSAQALQDGIVLLDTPGVDSTDDAHRMSTESALHLADVVFYVTDYNYVQSEMNASFMKQLHEWGKPLYLIVNMIDKHRENEVPFAQFREGIDRAFRDRGIAPAGILYVSVKHPQHPLNEWSRLQWLMRELAGRKDALSALSVRQSALYVAERHADRMAEANDDRKEQLREAIAEDGGAEEAAQRDRSLEERITELRGSADRRLDRLKKEIEAIAANANLTPAQTRDLGAAYLESRKPGFKVGLFFTAGKTAAERESRLNAFAANLQEQANTQLLWHLQALLKAELEQAGLAGDEELLARMNALELPVKPEWLSGKVKEGASFTGEYVLNFSRELSDDLKSAGRRAALDAAEALAGAAGRAAQAEAAQLERERGGLAER